MKVIDTAVTTVLNTHLQEAAERLRQAVVEDGDHPDKDGILNVAVSFMVVG